MTISGDGSFYSQNTSIAPLAVDFAFLKSIRGREIQKYKVLLYFNFFGFKAF
jgi:hypothetical protein